MSLTAERRAEIVAEARSWLRTPYHHAADIKGVGVDCAMILVRVYLKCCPWLPQDTDPRPYPQHWYLHRDEERYLGWIWKYCDRVEAPQPGDIALYKFGRTVSHGGILVEDGYLLHAYAHAGQVEITELRAIESRLDSYWSVR